MTTEKNLRITILTIFIISCFLNSIEFNNPLTSMPRAELKLTMLTFLLSLLLAMRNVIKGKIREIFIIKIFILFTITHFLSITNSPDYQVSLIQSLLVGIMALVYFSVLHALEEFHELEKSVKLVGLFCIIFLVTMLVEYFYDLGYYGRLGGNSKFIVGGPIYVGELLIIGAPFVYYVSKNSLIIKYVVTILMCLATALTLAKGVIISFIVLNLFLLKSEMKIIAGSAIVIVISAYAMATAGIIDYPKQWLSNMKLESTGLQSDSNTNKENQSNFLSARKYNIYQVGNFEELTSVIAEKSANSASIVHRMKAWFVTLKYSVKGPLLGYGSGTSEILLPKFAEKFDDESDPAIKSILKEYHAYGQNRNCCIDAHNSYLTNFFEAGFLSLLIFLFIFFRIIYFAPKKDLISNLFLATLIALMVHRLSINWSTIPNLYLIMGLVSLNSHLNNCDLK